jgi:phage anti-repressor protein
MNHLIQINETEINGELQLSVDARELYRFLEVGNDFSTWIKGRIADFGFIQGVDFSPLLKKQERENQGLSRFVPGQNKTDYILTLDMAKELAMLERSPKGTEARRYFIRIEKQSHIQTELLFKALGELIKAKPLWGKIRRYAELGLSNYEIAKLLDCCESTVRLHKQQMRALGLLPTNDNALVLLGGAQ